MGAKPAATRPAITSRRLRPWSRSFYLRSPDVVAQQLLGSLVVRRDGESFFLGRIVETEAYLAEGDPACHAARGPTRKNASMFGPPGHAYVYAIHSRWCLNVVTERAGIGSAVLIRAIEPLEGLDAMIERRGTSQLLDLARGPARLCEALRIDRALDGWDLTRGEQLWLAEDVEAAGSVPSIAQSPRIGVTSAHELLLRFFLPHCRFVSGSRRLNALAAVTIPASRSSKLR